MRRITGIAACFITIFLLLVSCGGRTVIRTLSDIESYINDRPDSALIAIRQIDTTALHGRAVKAKYALLHAMALDKNYIDTADTRIIQPAVEYYDRHGSPEDKLKAYMYQGIALYNEKLYDQAIISFYRAAENAANVNNQNLLGLLYSRMAVTHMQTRDYAQAAVYLDNSAESFRLCGQKSKEEMVIAQKARNLVQLRKWRDAEESLSEMISDTTISQKTKARLKLYQALTLLYSSDDSDSSAMSLFSQAISEGGVLNSPELVCAYAYTLGTNGHKDKSDSVFEKAKDFSDGGEFSYYYWNHRLKIKDGDYKRGYLDLWSAMQEQDSLLNETYSVSAANAGREFLERRNLEKTIVIHNQRDIIIFVVLLIVLLSLIVSLFRQQSRFKEKEQQEKRERMEVAIDNLKNQILEKEQEHDRLLTKIKYNPNQVKFSFLADLYYDVYSRSRNDKDLEEKLLSDLRTKIGNLRSDKEAQKNFEIMLNKETRGLMDSFRKDYPALSDDEYRMASYYFAGFDNTTVMLIMDISTMENTRLKKSRLKQKILGSSCGKKDSYISFL